MPKKISKEEFIERARKIHGDKFDYSKVKYTNNNTKVCIICPEHGEFWQRPSDHMLGRGCKFCYGRVKMNNKSFIEKAKKVHGIKYDYSEVNYNGSKNKVSIICHEKDKHGHEHGIFLQRPNDHLNGYGCPKCGNNIRKTTEEFIKEAEEVHGKKYDYSKVVYIGAHDKVRIVCPKHGEFLQEPSNHINGNGCPYCNCGNKSKMEGEIRKKLEEAKLNFKHQKTFDWLKFKRNLFLDFYVEDYNLAIEVQGDQHFLPIEKFGGNEDFIVRQERDKIKKKLCEEHGIKMFYITKKNYSLNEVLEYINETTKQKE